MWNLRKWLKLFLGLLSCICWRKKNSFFYMHITRTKRNLEWERYKWGNKENKQKEAHSSLLARNKLPGDCGLYFPWSDELHLFRLDHSKCSQNYLGQLDRNKLWSHKHKFILHLQPGTERSCREQAETAKIREKRGERVKLQLEHGKYNMILKKTEHLSVVSFCSAQHNDFLIEGNSH